MTSYIKDKRSQDTYTKVTNSHEVECGTIYHKFGGGIMKLEKLIYRLKVLSDYFYSNGIEDIYTNSKIYEVLIIVLAVVDKKNFQVVEVCYCNPDAIVSMLENKLQDKRERVETINRLSATIGVGDINNMIQRGNAKWVL